MATQRKKTSFTISQLADNLLAALSDKNDRSKASMLEVLIKEEANRQGITLSLKEPPTL